MAKITGKKPYVVLQLEELEMKMPTGEKVVYAGIKSFCANGKGEATLSLRDIAQRSGVSPATVFRNIPGLLKKDLLEVVGKGTGVGGTSSTYKVKCFNAEHFNHPKSVSYRNESVSYRNESVSSSGTKTIQSKKKKVSITNDGKNDFSPLTAEDLYKISTELNIALGHVNRKHGEILEMVESGEMVRKYPKNKSTYYTLRSWLRMALENGRIHEMTEIERLKNEHEEPTRKAKFEALKKAAIERGSL